MEAHRVIGRGLAVLIDCLLLCSVVWLCVRYHLETKR